MAFLDADDLWTQDKLEVQIAYLKSNPDCSLVLTAYAIFGKSQKFPRIVRHKNAIKMNKRWLNMRGFGGGLESIGLVSKTKLTEVGGFDEKLSTSSGLDLSIRLASIGSVHILPKVCMYYRISDGQWHGNHDPLKKDLERLVLKHGKGNKNRIKKSQAAYFYWTRLRSQGSTKIIWAFSRSILSLKLSQSWMLISLLSRGILAWISGYREKDFTQISLSNLQAKR